jgi:hypothetical protein
MKTIARNDLHGSADKRIYTYGTPSTPRRICQAEREGRCVVLPCKVGDRWWVSSGIWRPLDPPREACSICSSNFTMVRLKRGYGWTWRRQEGIRYTLGSFGKNVHITAPRPCGAEGVNGMEIKNGKIVECNRARTF